MIDKVYIVVKTQSNFYESELVGIDCVFEFKYEAKKYIDEKNSRSKYIRYVIKTKDVK